MLKNKINVEQLEWQESEHDDFGSARKQLAAQAGGKQLGCSLYKVMPGKKAFPYHYHLANEEAILILSGNGMLRLGEEKVKVNKDDYIALPIGADHAHQIINDSDEPLLYLCFSTMIEPEVMGYPDLDKIGVMTGSAPGQTKNTNSFKVFYPKDKAVSYYEGEK